MGEGRLDAIAFLGRWLASMPSETAMTTISTAPASCALQVFIGRVRLYNEGTRPKLQKLDCALPGGEGEERVGLPGLRVRLEPLDDQAPGEFDPARAILA